MNRIYQGRVTRVEIFSGTNGEFQPLANWQEKLWQHHELFQDAVNYYTLALAAMASNVTGTPPAAKALRNWVDRVRDTWSTASRKAKTFDGPQKRLATLLKLQPNQTDFDSAAKAILQPSRATPT